MALGPAGPWGNYYWGVCAYRMGRLDDAEAAFSAAIGSDADRAEYFENRSLAYHAFGRDEEARRDDERVAARPNEVRRQTPAAGQRPQ